MRVRRAVDLCPDSDAALFKRAVKGVIKLSVEPRADVHRPRATPLRRARREEAPLPVAAPALSDDFEPAVLTDEEGWGSPDGQPVLKAKVRLWLAQIEDVIAFCPARLQHGGEGVVIVLLRSPR